MSWSISLLQHHYLQLDPGTPRSSDGVITKLANSLRNIEISLFFLISITFQGAGAAESL